MSAKRFALLSVTPCLVLAVIAKRKIELSLQNDGAFRARLDYIEEIVIDESKLGPVASRNDLIDKVRTPKKPQLSMDKRIALGGVYLFKQLVLKLQNTLSVLHTFDV